MISLRRESVTEVAAGVAIVALLAGLSLVVWPRPPQTLEGTAPRAECLAGSCWRRPVGSVDVQLLPLGRESAVDLGDEVLTLGTGSSMLVLIPERQAELRLKDTAVVRVTTGLEKVQAATDEQAGGNEGAGGMSQSRPPTSSLIYVGEVSIDMRSPLPDVPIVATGFPSQIHFSFVVDAEGNKGLGAWILATIEGDQLQSIARFETQEESIENGAKVQRFGDVAVPGPGTYAFLPAVAEFAPKNVALRIEVTGEKGLEKGIEDALQGLKTDTDTQIEIRGK